MQKMLFEGLLRRAVVAVRKRGLFDAADEAENFVSAWEAGRIYEPRGRPDALAEWFTALNKELRLDSTGHRARVRFQPERAWNLALGDETLSISDSSTGVTWELRLGRDHDPEKSRAVVVESPAFLDRASAQQAASRLEAAILAVSVRMGYGFALNDRLPPSVITEHGFKHLVPDGVRGIKEDLGITIYETPPATIFVHLSDIKMSVSVQTERFVELLEAALSLAAPVDERIRTAYELFSSSRFENSSRARFLLLVMAVEAMVKRVRRPAAEIAFIDATLRQLGSSTFSSGSKKALTGGLEELKRQSIGASTSAQITGELSIEAASEFKKMYGIRSRLVHGGKPVAPSELNDASNKLEPYVKAMLLKRLEGEPAGSFPTDPERPPARTYRRSGYAGARDLLVRAGRVLRQLF